MNKYMVAGKYMYLSKNGMQDLGRKEAKASEEMENYLN